MTQTIEHTPTNTPTQLGVPARRTTIASALSLSPKAIMFRTLNAEIPNNDLGLPAYYHRADLLPSTLDDLDADEQADLIETSTVELDYSQGFPTTPLGEPFWGCLPHEPQDAYRAFIAYLDLPTRADKDGGSSPVRQLHLLATQLATTSQNLVELSYIYYWQVRSRAYDLFKLAAHSRLREQRLMTVENEHYNMASDYIAFADNFLRTVFADPEGSGLKPRDAMDLLLKMIQVQRLSIGVAPFSNPTGKGGGSADGIPQNASLEVILRTIATQMGTANTGGTAKEADMADITKRLLADPSELNRAQELIIRMNSSGDRTRNLAPVSVDDNPYDNRS